MQQLRWDFRDFLLVRWIRNPPLRWDPKDWFVRWRRNRQLKWDFKDWFVRQLRWDYEDWFMRWIRVQQLWWDFKDWYVRWIRVHQLGLDLKDWFHWPDLHVGIIYMFRRKVFFFWFFVSDGQGETTAGWTRKPPWLHLRTVSVTHND